MGDAANDPLGPAGLPISGQVFPAIQPLVDVARRLAAPHRTAFAASCAERLFTNYELFMCRSLSGNAAALRAAIDAVWEYLQESKGFSIEVLTKTVAQLEELAPDLDDAQSELASPALDAVASAREAVLSCVDQDSEHVRWASQYAYTTVDIYAQVTSQLPSPRDQPDAYPRGAKMILRELELQKADLDLLQSIPAVDVATLDIMRRRSAQEGAARAEQFDRALG